MADQVCILVHRPPYGAINAAEALRHLNGATAHGLETTAILLGDGVYVARTGQVLGTTGWRGLSSALENTLEHAEEGYPRLWVDEASLRARGIENRSLVPGAVVVNGPAIADAVSRARWVMVY